MRKKKCFSTIIQNERKKTDEELFKKYPYPDPNPNT